MTKGVNCECGHLPNEHTMTDLGPGACAAIGCDCEDYIPGEAAIEVPDVLGEVEGWRAWSIVGPSRFPRLQSVTHTETVWPAAEWTLADCRGEHSCSKSDDGKVPGERCTCGLYAARDRQHLIQLGYAAYSEDLTAGGKVIGKVGLVGKVIPGSQGWRAEKGRIVELYVPPKFWKYAEALERIYKCKAITEDTLAGDRADGRYIVVPRAGGFVAVDKYERRVIGKGQTRDEAQALIALARGEG